MEYTKPWLTLEQQIDKLMLRGVEVNDRRHAELVLQAVGYYRLTGYLYPFRTSEVFKDDFGRTQRRILNENRPGTNLHLAESIIDFDRTLRALVMEGIERIEVALRMRLGYVLGQHSAFAHEEFHCFDAAFTAPINDTRHPKPSKHVEWLQRVSVRSLNSDDTFVKHFQQNYEGRIPIWALTELLELGNLAVLYRGLNQANAEEVARAFGVPTKRIFASWLASLNYVRNASAHHSRLFNRKLQYAPARPKTGVVPLLDHLQAEQSSKATFGVYNALAVIGYLLKPIDLRGDWQARLVAHLASFPESFALSIDSMGAPKGWAEFDLWHPNELPR